MYRPQVSRTRFRTFTVPFAEVAGWIPSGRVTRPASFPTPGVTRKRAEVSFLQYA